MVRPCEVWWVGQNQCHTPPYLAKNKFLLNEYLGISKRFESIFFYFFKSGKLPLSPYLELLAIMSDTIDYSVERFVN